jgi:4-carboxymuconolactone decarboxylase
MSLNPLRRPTRFVILDGRRTSCTEPETTMGEARGLDIAPGGDIPHTFKAFTERFPAIADAHQAIGRAGDEAGPLDRKTAELIKLGMCLASGLESATKSHARRAVQHGATREEVEQAIVMGVNSCGLPRVIMAWQWAMEQLDAEERRG